MSNAILIEEFASFATAKERVIALRTGLGISVVQKPLGNGYGVYGTQEQRDRIRADRPKARLVPSPTRSPVAQPSTTRSTPRKPAGDIVHVPVRPPAATAKSTLERVRVPIRPEPEGPRSGAGIWSMSADEASRMAEELRHAFRKLSPEDAKNWVGRSSDRLAAVLLRRMHNLVRTCSVVLGGIGNEVIDFVNAVIDRRPIDHTKARLNAAANEVTRITQLAKNTATPLFTALRNDPAKVAPDLIIVALSFYVSGGGFDGDGGIPDSDIPLLGIGAHRSPFTHSVIAGAVVETGLFSLIDFVCIAHSKLPEKHDPRWDLIHDRAWTAATAASKGVSLGLAYHLGVDSLIQPGAYHGLPFEMSIEGHQFVLGANAAAEGIDAGKKEGKPKTTSSHPRSSPAASRPVARTEEGSGRKVGNLIVGGLVTLLGVIGLG